MFETAQKMRLVPLAIICVGFDLICFQASAGTVDIVDYVYPDGKTLQIAK